jgi:hypothetical protein
MAILAIFTGDITKDQYDTIRKEIDWDHNHPAGAVFHAASFDENGRAHVADVWESADELNAFAQSSLMPAFQKFGFTPPNVEVYPAHNVGAYAGISKYLIG